VERCEPGATVGDVVAAAQTVFARSPHAAHAGGLMGHGIGLETVEAPYVQAGGRDELVPGMVLCIEPGLFVPGWAGASIEQEVIIAETGPPEVITPTATRLW
jgi:Xaa-Pro aminopeptidase